MQVNGTAARLFRVKHVASVLDVHVSTVYRLIESERLGSVRIGFGKGAIRIPSQALNDYLVSLGLAPLGEGDASEGAVA
jgi:excisionase family DNA binding protein